jgi:hypothetical protein
MKIYFISSGTSCNDIISSINDIITKNRAHFKLSEKLSFSEVNRLQSNGVKEMYMAQQNPFFISKLLTNNCAVFTELDYDVIESALVLYHTNQNQVIYPIPVILDKIKKYKYIPLLKSLFGKTNNETKKYWKEKNLNAEFFNVKEKVPKMNWKFIQEKDITYPYNPFVLKKFILSVLYYSSEFDNKTLIFVVKPSIILSILRECRDTVYIPELHTVERSSIWEMECKKEGNELKFKSYEKMYPKEYNYQPLKYTKSNTFEYEFKNKQYSLIPFPVPIFPLFLDGIVLSRFPSKERSSIEKILSRVFKKNTEKEQNIDIKNVTSTKNKKITMEGLLSV